MGTNRAHVCDDINVSVIKSNSGDQLIERKQDKRVMHDDKYITVINTKAKHGGKFRL